MANLSSKSARLNLAAGTVHWSNVVANIALGYRRGPTGGKWLARWYDGSRQHKAVIGSADDIAASDRVTTLSHSEAVAAAIAWARKRAGADAELDTKLTVEIALTNYFNERISRGSKSVSKDQSKAKSSIIPVLGAIVCEKLTTKQINNWLYSLANTKPDVRKPRYGKKTERTTLETTDADVIRARRASANRCLNVLKAALNHSYREGQIASDSAWRRVKPFAAVDVPIIRFLTADEVERLLEACDVNFRAIVEAALHTGCRYGELTRLRRDDFNPQTKTISIRISKSNKPRIIYLNQIGLTFFNSIIKDFNKNDLIFTKSNKTQWKDSDQQRPLKAALAAAKLEEDISFHILRHTYASHLIQSGVPLTVIASQLGHSDTRMTEKHYAHLSTNYISSAIWDGD